MDLKNVQSALLALSGKWKLLVLMTINNGNKRFGEIEKSIAKITPKVLSKELDELERLGFIKKGSPQRSAGHPEYHLTPHYKTLRKIIKEMKKWGSRYGRRVA